MKRILSVAVSFSAAVLAGLWMSSSVQAQDTNTYNDLVPPTSQSSQEAARKEISKAKKSMGTMSELEDLKPPISPTTAAQPAQKGTHPAEAFVVGPDWEFDGFVAGGQDEKIKSMFSVNDLVYLNVGSDRGLKPGDLVGLYRRGDKIRDPQTNRLIGYEVRKIAVAEVSDRIEPGNCSVRIVKSYEPVEIGDLVRREE